MNRRMNLFRQLKTPVAKKRVPTDLASAKKAGLSLGFHVIVGTVILGGALVGFLAHYFGYRQNVAEIKDAIAASEKQLAELVEQSQAIARKPAAAAVPPPSAAATASPARPTGSQLDGTWTSLLWKLASATDTSIRLQKMTLNTTGAAPTPTPEIPNAPGAPKQVVLEGSARTAAAVRDWLELLIKTIPGYEFSLDSQSQKGEAVDYPIEFRVTARFI